VASASEELLGKWESPRKTYKGPHGITILEGLDPFDCGRPSNQPRRPMHPSPVRLQEYAVSEIAHERRKYGLIAHSNNRASAFGRGSQFFASGRPRADFMGFDADLTGRECPRRSRRDQSVMGIIGPAAPRPVQQRSARPLAHRHLSPI
jgi:hypothetical protein